MPLYEYHCNRCGDFDAAARIAERRLQPCPECGALSIQIIKTPPHTDVLGHEHYCDVNEVTYTSRREYEKKMAAGGWEPAGDKVGGARSEHRLKGTLFSYDGQSARTSPAVERNV